MQTLLGYLPSTKTCKLCGLLIKCSSEQDQKIHKRLCKPYIIMKSGSVVQSFYDKEQKSLDGKFILSKKCRKIVYSKKNQRIYDHIIDIQGAVGFEYSGMFSFVDKKLQLLGCLFFEKFDSILVIRYIWTHSLHKRKKIATKLMTATVKHMKCKLTDVQCTELTEEGSCFFKSYFDGSDMQIYED